MNVYEVSDAGCLVMTKLHKQVVEALNSLDSWSRFAFDSTGRRDLGMISPLPLLAALAGHDLRESILSVGPNVSWQVLYLYPEQFDVGDEPIGYPDGLFVGEVFLEQSMFGVLRLALSIAKAQEQSESVRTSTTILLASIAVEVFRRDARLFSRLELADTELDIPQAEPVETGATSTCGAEACSVHEAVRESGGCLVPAQHPRRFTSP